MSRTISSNASSEIYSVRSMNEHFRTLPASLGAITSTRLQKHRRLSMRDSNALISTAISGTGRLATATASEIRLYDLESQNHARDIVQYCEFPVKMISKNEKIRAVTISDDLLAIVTHLRLIVFEYRENGKVEDNVLEDLRIDVSEAWTPKSVSILQVKSADTRQSAAAWIAVGGEGVNGVKLYQYSQTTGWNAHRNHRTILKCPRNTSSIRTVGFSQFVRENKFFVFGVTSENRIFCWDVGLSDTTNAVTGLGWELDGNMRQNSLSHRAEIAAISIFESPSSRPYIFCAVDQKHGSQRLRSFIAPLDRATVDSDIHWRSLPEKLVERHVLTGAVTPNGRFLVMLEEGVMKLLTLHGAYEGGLTCLEQTLEWHSPLKGAAKDVSVIIKERQGGLTVVAVDGRGHLLFTRISVPDMPLSAEPTLIRRYSTTPVEMPAGMIVRELHGEGIRRPVPSSSRHQVNWEDIEDEIRVMLG